MRVVFASVTWILVFCFASSSLAAQDWNEFRGENGKGHSTFKNIPLNWDDHSDNIRWKTELEGLGWSSPVVSNHRVWLTAADETANQLRLLQLDSKSGRLLKSLVVFETPLGNIHKKNSHASPTAIIEGDLIWVHFGDYGTACVHQSGRIVWKKVLPYGHFHGPGGSPVVYRDRLILSCDGGEKQFLVALDKNTGKQIWQTQKKHIHPDRFTGGKMKPIAFSTPTLRKIGMEMEVVVCGADHIAGFDVETGKEKWWAAYDGYSIVPRPVFYRDMVFYASCYNSPVLYGLKIEGRGELTAKIAWETKKGAPHNPTPLVVGSNLYTVSDRGIAQCLDAQSGKVHWQQRLGRGYSASPVFVDGKIYYQDETGGTVVVKPGEEYRELANNRINGRTLATPVPVENGLLIRTDQFLMCIDGPK